ncbi:hypothetical protein [Cohnella panacarvi]|uniref:hypothetical protein n=1 Tax=Cohnella panacarvi TaxID=400776 RepID=UPI00047BB06A|nr:hypothetical protein [Cohnella panacarvi]
MAEPRKQDLKIIGETTSSGGQFGNVRITGQCTFRSDLDCNRISCIGQTDVQGNLRAGELKLTGEAAVGGTLDAGRVGGRGQLNVSSRLRGEQIQFTGEIKVGDDCEAGDLAMLGAFDVHGLVSAERLELKMLGSCKAKEIGGGRLVVRRSRKSALIHLFKPSSVGSLVADSIEGDVVELEHTTAQVVRGNHVTIGAGCQIGRVEYTQTLDVHKNAVVQEMVRQA